MAFMIVHQQSQPIYELDLSRAVPGRGEDAARGAQFLLHSALDNVDSALWTSKECYLKVVDRHNEQLVSAYVTAGGLKLLLLHEARGEAAAAVFFGEVHELLVKVGLNPFYVPGSRLDVVHKDFDARVKALARRLT